MRGVCHIVCAGDVTVLPEKGEGDLVIACDAGLRALPFAPDVFVGDGDSLGYIPDFPDALVLPSVKDDTDSAAAVKLGFERGYREFRIYGALGGSRLSHSIANIELLSYIEKRGGYGVVVDKRCTVRLITPASGAVSVAPGGYFSLFAHGGDAAVSITRAKYEGDGIALSPSFPLGVSNEPFEGCRVAVLRGEALLVVEK